jgi:hypothetical protein
MTKDQLHQARRLPAKIAECRLTPIRLSSAAFMGVVVAQLDGSLASGVALRQAS